MGLELLLLLLLCCIGCARTAVECAVWASQQWRLIRKGCIRALDVIDSTECRGWRASMLAAFDHAPHGKQKRQRARSSHGERTHQARRHRPASKRSDACCAGGYPNFQPPLFSGSNYRTQHTAHATPRGRTYKIYMQMERLSGIYSTVPYTSDKRPHKPAHMPLVLLKYCMRNLRCAEEKPCALPIVL